MTAAAASVEYPRAIRSRTERDWQNHEGLRSFYVIDRHTPMVTPSQMAQHVFFRDARNVFVTNRRTLGIVELSPAFVSHKYTTRRPEKSVRTAKLHLLRNNTFNFPSVKLYSFGLKHNVASSSDLLNFIHSNLMDRGCSSCTVRVSAAWYQVC